MSLYGFGNGYHKQVDEAESAVVASVVLTVSEGKRLIAKAVAKMPIVRKALRKGMVIICKGTTNTYIAEEILESPVVHGSYVLGRIYPWQNGKKLPAVSPVNEIILINGVRQPDMSLEDAVSRLGPGDVVIKGANLLDYKNNLAGVCIGSPTSGTAGTVIPYVIARRAHLVIPIGLEKLVAGNLADIAATINAPTEQLNSVPAMYVITGHIVTEIDAIKQLADVNVCETACGGIGGQEGGRWFAVEGKKEQVQKMLKIVEQVHGEPPFVE